MVRLTQSLFLVLLFPSLIVSQQPASPALLTLDEALRIALNENAQVESARLDVAKAQEAVGELSASRLPQLNADVLSGLAINPLHFTIPRGAIGDLPGIGPLPAIDMDFNAGRKMTAMIHASAAQPLTQLYKLNLGIHEARIGEELAKENLRLKRQQTVQQVREAYDKIALAQVQVEAAEASVKSLGELNALMERRLGEEAVLKADALAVAAQVAQQRYQTMTLRDGLDSQKEAFNRLLGRDPGTDFTVETMPAPSVEEQDLEAARAKAMQQRPEIRLASLQAETAGLEVRRERAAYLPDLSLQLSYLDFANISFAPLNYSSAGVLFRWQPFDWGQKHHQIEELKSAARQAELTRTDAGRQVWIDVGVQFRKLAEARLLVAAGEAGRAAAEERLRVTEEQFAQKAALPADLLRQQAAAAEANSQWSQAVAAFWAAEAEYHRALGDE
jgi:outer membrane protein TolC